MVELQTLLKTKTQATQDNTYKCKVCSDTGWLTRRDENGSAFGTKCECLIKSENMERIKKSGLERVIQEKRFDNYEIKEPFQKRIKELAMQYTEKGINEGKWFFIGGQSGCGKSHICTAIAEYAINTLRRSVRYENANRLISILKSNANDCEAYESIFNRIARIDILYLDDLLKTDKVTAADERHLFDLINERYIQNKITIISSEKKIQDMEIYNELEAVTGRILEKADEYVLNINKDSGKNYRKLK